mgnify:FL=1
MINRDRIVVRREELQKQLEQCRSNYIALQGALSDLDFLLSEPDNPEPPAERNE